MGQKLYKLAIPQLLVKGSQGFQTVKTGEEMYQCLILLHGRELVQCRMANITDLPLGG